MLSDCTPSRAKTYFSRFRRSSLRTFLLLLCGLVPGWCIYRDFSDLGDLLDANGSQNDPAGAPFGLFVAPFWEPWASLGIQGGPGPPKAPPLIDSEVTFESIWGEMGKYLASLGKQSALV